jgi:hypothetical protein
VSTVMENRMFTPGRWIDHVKTFTNTGMSSGPSKRMETSESEAEDEVEVDAEAEDEVDAVDAWFQCDNCQTWRNLGSECHLNPHAKFYCSYVKNHTCHTP